MRTDFEDLVSVLMTKLQRTTKLAHSFLFAKSKYLKASFILHEQLKLSSQGEYPFDHHRFQIILHPERRPFCFRTKSLSFARPFVFISLLPSSHLLFSSSLCGGPMTVEQHFKKCLTPANSTLILWDRRTTKRKFGSVWEEMRGCQLIVEALSPVQ